MPAIPPRLLALAGEQRLQLEAWLAEFEEAWDEDLLAARVERLPPPGHPLRLPALIELVKIDLERSRQRGRQLRLADYVARYPELGPAETLPSDLLQAEEEIRRQFNEAWMTLRVPADGAPASPAPLALSVRAADQVPCVHGYEVLGKLGQGGMGAIYKARHLRLNRVVALKVIRFGAESAEQVERFYREARIAASFTHPNLCPVYDFDERGGVHYLTMPLLGGEPLSTFLAREAPLPAGMAVRLTALIARAVHEAHLAGIVHRDLKPSNIMMNERGQPVVMDFGLARRVGLADARLTAPGALLGTPAYMPPEVAADGSVDSGPAHDVYSLGVILYEMLTGRLPFSGTVNEIIALVLTQEPASPSHLRPGLDPRLESVCLTAMARHPSRRFSSMAVFAEALEPLASLDDRSTNKTDPAAARRRLQIRRVAFIMITLLILGLGGWIAWHVPGWLSRHTDHPDAKASVAAQNTQDHFQPECEWVGFLRWRGTDYNRPVLVTIKERDGNRFTGIYNAEDGDYLWRIEGSIEQQNVEWRFTDIIREKDPKRVAGVATVSGTLAEDGRLDAQFQGPDGRANVVLKPKR
jgi:serine/threonine protein kinase